MIAKPCPGFSTTLNQEFLGAPFIYTSRALPLLAVCSFLRFDGDEFGFTELDFDFGVVARRCFFNSLDGSAIEVCDVDSGVTLGRRHRMIC